MVCQTNHALDQFLEHIILRLNMKDGTERGTWPGAALRTGNVSVSGLIRVGGRCKNEQILPFSLTKSRERYREGRLIPSYIYEQKREILNKKFSSEHAILLNEKIVGFTFQHLTSMKLLNDRQVILPQHYSSLMLGSGNFRQVETTLNKWLGLTNNVTITNAFDYGIEELTGAMGSTGVAQGDADADEEHDEEERRRDEIDDDEEFFRPIRQAPQVKFAPRREEKNDDDDAHDDQWQTKVNKTNQKRAMYQLLNNPTSLTDARVQGMNEDLWQLRIPERHDLYRYWLKKYREACYKSVSDAQVNYNQAANAHMQYLQLEDYHILKDAIVVAMTTTCAAKYFDVLQKLGRVDKEESRFSLIIVFLSV